MAMHQRLRNDIAKQLRDAGYHLENTDNADPTEIVKSILITQLGRVHAGSDISETKAPVSP